MYFLCFFLLEVARSTSAPCAMGEGLRSLPRRPVLGRLRRRFAGLPTRTRIHRGPVGIPEEQMFDDLEPWSDLMSRNGFEESVSSPTHSLLSATMQTITPENWLKEVDDLVKSSESRFAGGEGVEVAENYLVKTFKDIGLDDVSVQNTGCFIKQNGKKRYFDNGDPAFEVKNVVATLKGTTNPDQFVLIGAHFDSRHALLNANDPAPGADDNGSGCAAVVQCARLAKKLRDSGHTFDKSVVFALFGGEEVGLIGSEQYVKECVLPKKENFHGAVILDQIGYINKEGNGDPISRIVFETVKTTTRDVHSQVENMVKELGCISKHAEKNTELYCNWFGVGSDHMPFLESNLPAVLLIARDYFSNEHKHSSTDTIEHLDTHQGAHITQAAALQVLSMATEQNSEVVGSVLGSHSDSASSEALVEPVPAISAISGAEIKAFSPVSAQQNQMDELLHISDPLTFGYPKEGSKVEIGGATFVTKYSDDGEIKLISPKLTTKLQQENKISEELENKYMTHKSQMEEALQHSNEIKNRLLVADDEGLASLESELLQACKTARFHRKQIHQIQQMGSEGVRFNFAEGRVSWVLRRESEEGWADESEGRLRFSCDDDGKLVKDGSESVESSSSVSGSLVAETSQQQLAPV